MSEGKESSLGANSDRREVIFDLLKLWFGKEEFQLEFAWHELRNSRARRLYPDLELEDVQDWLFAATDVSSEVPPEVTKNPTLGFKREVRTYTMLDVETSIRTWKPRIWIQRELRKLALERLEGSSKVVEEDANDCNGTSELDSIDSKELERRISKSIGKVREEFERDQKKKTKRVLEAELKLEAWVRRRFLDDNLVYDEAGRRVRGLRFEPRFRRNSDGTYEFSELTVVSFPSKEEVNFEEFVDDLGEDLIRDPIDAATKVGDPNDRIVFMGDENLNYEHLRSRGWSGPGWYVWGEGCEVLYGPFETEISAETWFKIWCAKDEEARSEEVKFKKRCGEGEQKRSKERSIDGNGRRKLVFYSPFGHEVEVKGWSGSGYYFWADDGSAVYGPYDSKFSASNARDEYEKALERERNR